MTEPRLCPSCGRENTHDALFCVACETMLPLDSASLHAAVGESPELPASVLRCPRCFTRNSEDQVYCWRCLHELHSSDAVDDASPRPLTAALAKASNTPPPAPEPEASPFAPESEPTSADDEAEADSGTGPGVAPPIAASVEIEDEAEGRPEPIVIPAPVERPTDVSLMPTFAAASAIERDEHKLSLIHI